MKYASTVPAQFLWIKRKGCTATNKRCYVTVKYVDGTTRLLRYPNESIAKQMAERHSDD